MAEFKRFNPDGWEPDPDGGGVAKVAEVAKDGTTEPLALATFSALAGAQPLPGTVGAGLAALDAERPPRGVPAAAWRTAVQDAKSLASQGWAGQALSLGWTALDLFGAVADPAGDPEADGLAVKLDGRRVLALCATFATVCTGPGVRSYFYRGNNEGASLLWDLGRRG